MKELKKMFLPIGSRWFEKSDFFWSWVSKVPSFSKERYLKHIILYILALHLFLNVNSEFSNYIYFIYLKF